MFIRGLIFVVSVSSMAWAQIATATLSGTVTDEAGTPLSGVAGYGEISQHWKQLVRGNGE